MNYIYSKLPNYSNCETSDDFKTTHSEEKRKSDAAYIKLKYPNRIPVICESKKKSGIVLDKKKYLVPGDITIGQFLYILRQRIKLAPEEAIFLHCNNTLLCTSDLISNVYKAYADTDNYLYFNLEKERTFG
jgi:GABA(A) receptor-associated protein